MQAESIQALDRDWMTRKQASAYLQCSLPTIDRLIANGSLKVARLGSGPKARVRISAASIERMLGR